MHSPLRKANALKFRFRNSRGWPIYIINSVDKTKLSHFLICHHMLHNFVCRSRSRIPYGNLTEVHLCSKLPSHSLFFFYFSVCEYGKKFNTCFLHNFRLNADLDIAKRYGLIKDGTYVLPRREDVILHRVVIATLAVSRHLLELRLNHGFFTHILIDEAYQALEPEALIPLALAGPNTKVVFTGDHMQVQFCYLWFLINFFGVRYFQF